MNGVVRDQKARDGTDGGTLRWRESIIRHEHYLASKLNVGPGKKVLDVGCGVGGPLREIAAFTGASVTGLNNNEFQVGGSGCSNNPWGPLPIIRCCSCVYVEFSSDGAHLKVV